MRNEITFISGGVSCAGWHLEATSDALADPAGRPCVVMAHGFSATRDTGLLSFAEPFAAAGIDVLVFDYRGFGDSEGEPRQNVSVRRQRHDVHAAIAAARHLPGIDPSRIAVWGYSYGGGHGVVVAVQDQSVAAVVAMNPATDGCATLAEVLRTGGPGRLAKLTAHGLHDAARAITRREPYLVPVIGRSGSRAMITAAGAESFADSAGPAWRNEVCARAALMVAMNRPNRLAGRLASPVLVQTGIYDTVAPPGAARRTAKKAGYLAQLREYPIDHFQAFQSPWHEQVLADQLSFLTQALAPTTTSTTWPAASRRSPNGRPG